MTQIAKEHFIKRAQRYNCSSQWVGDAALINKIYSLANPGQASYVLDIAIGTGKISERFRNEVKYMVGVDICIDMIASARQHADGIVISPAEKMPFKNNIFDICVCRQGLQFMDVEKVLKQAHRVLKPKGTIVCCHLSAYNDTDKDTAFLIQKLRNPARKNFFLPKDWAKFLKRTGFSNVENIEYISRESINRWIDNGAIGFKQREKIKTLYRQASNEFKRIHNIQFKGQDIYDDMKIVIIKGQKQT